MRTIARFSKSIMVRVDKKIKRYLHAFGPKIFCISLQRTGTTSTGSFFKDHGYIVATYNVSKENSWSPIFFGGDYERIFKSRDFRISQVFEDDPWWLGDFYKFLYHRFPTSKFILLERDANQWFDSMISHSEGRTLGNTHLHCANYQRLRDLYETTNGRPEHAYTGIIDNALPLGETQRAHYTSFYKIRNEEVKLFFRHHDGGRLFNANLDEDGLWQKMGQYFQFDVAPEYNIHINKSSKRISFQQNESR